MASALSADRFPLVYGADCSVLLAAIPALRAALGEAGLMFLDGHEDATSMDASPTDEAANMEIALLLGLTGERAPELLRAGREEAERIASQAPGWWLHTDLDVLTRSEFTARGAPGEILLPGGLTWIELTETVSAALRTGGCRGWSVAVYNPDLDPGKQAATRIVEFVTDVVRGWP